MSAQPKRRRTHIEPPPEGWPWDKPGHRFWTPGFPPGYVPHLASDTFTTLSEKRKAESLERTTPKGKY
jgi:hypothetical protein